MSGTSWSPSRRKRRSSAWSTSRAVSPICARFLDDYFDRHMEEAIAEELATDAAGNPGLHGRRPRDQPPARRRRFAPARRSAVRSASRRQRRSISRLDAMISPASRCRPCSTPTATRRGTRMESRSGTRTATSSFSESPIWLDERLPARAGGGPRQLDRAIGPGDQDEPRRLPAQRRLPAAAAPRADRSRR